MVPFREDLAGLVESVGSMQSDGCIATSKSILGGLTDLIPCSHGDSGRLCCAEAARIESAVFFIKPSASPTITRCLLAAASTRSAQLRKPLLLHESCHRFFCLTSSVPARTLCLLAVASVGSGQFRLCVCCSRGVALEGPVVSAVVRGRGVKAVRLRLTFQHLSSPLEGFLP
ncbi:hypothetical protein F2Q69_00033840 [Brassica cretica]|uniref:Uncharacterized protein n=1 Tax=Brassica cretica TaxID=69181 RepID=A0A8S9SEW8_BRACR|nr:hypothetical protein F2Q69_00033840 [Brassica cretica]